MKKKPKRKILRMSNTIMINGTLASEVNIDQEILDAITRIEVAADLLARRFGADLVHVKAMKESDTMFTFFSDFTT